MDLELMKAWYKVEDIRKLMEEWQESPDDTLSKEQVIERLRAIVDRRGVK